MYCKEYILKHMQEKEENHRQGGVNTKSEVALREEKIMYFWREHKTFEKSLEKDSPKGNYVFYDGPPFATGQMHYGHILGSTAKDVIGRYQTMRGYHVPRKWGWDCHGLPIENIVEKELGIAGHNEIEKYGIDKFVEYARSKVLEYDADWRVGIERIGRWVDFDGGYKTMDNDFIESVWWALAELNKKGLIYEGVRVLAYCARCETPIANSEIAMDNSYKDIADISVYVKFELEDEFGTESPSLRSGRSNTSYLIAWTTTPWTLPGNTAIAVNKDIEYVKVEADGVNYILAEATLGNVFKEKSFKILEKFKGDKLVGRKYKPVFPYYLDADMPNKENIYKVWHADFVTTDMGTGIAHEAPAFGEDDMNLAREHKIPWIIHVDETGRFKSEVKDFSGLKVKPKDTAEDKDMHLRSDIEVIKYLQANGSYFAKEKITHSYPHCMRCDTPIIYYALPSWFVDIQKSKPIVQKTAEFINWVPEHLKEGRYKNIVDSAPDWNISRNRYWASPLPVWKCDTCDNQEFISSLEDLKEKSVKSGNKYFVMRHGESEGNITGVISSYSEHTDHLTELGKKQVFETSQKLKDKNINLIIYSDLARTRETAEIIKKELGILDENFISTKKIREISTGVWDGKRWTEYVAFIKNEGMQRYLYRPDNGESGEDVKARMARFLYEIDSEYRDKNILIITHEGPARILYVGALGMSSSQMEEKLNNKEIIVFKNAEVNGLNFVPFPHNANFELDMHRPYIDAVKLKCKCGGEMTRITEVLDCWFESGSMTFAEDHYPFESADWQEKNFPAGFVAEYIAQTRTWFYYMHVVSALLFNHAPFKNVVTTGTLRAEDGQKMSKSKHNYPDPWVFIDKYGVDALRIYLMSSPLMKGEDANFSEKLVQEISSKIVGRFHNTMLFYELYRDKNLEDVFEKDLKNVLNKWIVGRLDEVITEVTKGMEAYDMAMATRPLDLFVDDLSTWYLRRSRDAIKDGDKETKQTLYFVLKTFARLMAPFAPFIAEEVWRNLRGDTDEESVHLVEWPEAGSLVSDKNKITQDMADARRIVSLGLEARQRTNIKVRQPLSKISVKTYSLSREYEELIKDELNVKELKEDKNLENEVLLDTDITEELKQEGDYRELLRGLQDLRKKLGLTPKDLVTLSLECDDAGKRLVSKYEENLLKTVLVSKVTYEKNNGEEILVGELSFKVKMEK